MIRWMDFDLASEFGPLLVVPEGNQRQDELRITSYVLRTVRKAQTTEEKAQRVRMTQTETGTQFQETGQGQRPARMVGQPDLDSNDARNAMDGQWTDPTLSAIRGQR